MREGPVEQGRQRQHKPIQCPQPPDPLEGVDGPVPPRQGGFDLLRCCVRAGAAAEGLLDRAEKLLDLGERAGRIAELVQTNLRSR